MQFLLLFSRQGKLRLQKWYITNSDRLKKKITRELITTILARKPKMCSFLEWRDLKIVYKRLLHEILQLFSVKNNNYCINATIRQAEYKSKYVFLNWLISEVIVVNITWK